MLQERELGIKLFAGVPRLHLFLEAVAESTYGGQAPRIVGLLLDVLAQPADVHVNGAGRHEALLSPDLFEELIAAVSAAGMHEEEFEQLELGGGKIELAFAQEDAVRVAIQPERANLGRGALLFALAAAEGGFDARHQFPWAERLGHVIVAAYFKTQHAVDFVRAGGQKQHRRASQHGRLANLAAELEAVVAGEHHVEDY